MTDPRVTSFSIPGLEYVFVPPGLPLVTKGDGPTTSILVRGGAGTGKTTLAVALAHAISKQCDGVALYLITEFVATELSYKTAALQLPMDSVLAWDTPGEHAPGTIFARHLLQTRAGQDDGYLELVGNRKHAAVEAIWESVTPSGEPSAARPEGPPVRAVVIDAFGLPDAEGEDPKLRNELLTLVQSLEDIGVSVIIVEEAGDLVQTWLSFVVDIVFETELAPGEDTGSLLLRRLKCPKSRYGQALPGPHDYGLDLSKTPAVWPDLAFANAWEAIRSTTNLAPTFFVDQGDRFGLYPAGSVIVSDWGAERPYLDAFVALPGSEIAVVWCGPLTGVEIADTQCYVAEGQGLFALVWLLIRACQAGQINAVLFHDFDYFLSATNARRGVRAITMLGAMGLSVCLHGDLKLLEPATPVAYCVQGHKHITSTRHQEPRPRLCRADRWVGQPLDIGPEEPPTQALPWHLHGRFGAAHVLAEDALEVRERIAYLMRVGAHLEAARILRPTPRYPDELHAWASLAAIHAGNQTALEQLATAPTPLDADDTISLLRALAAQQQLDRLATTIDDCRQRWNLPAWYVKRLHAELLLDADPADRAARQQLDELAASDEVPNLHRAEIYYNIGILDDQRDHEAARAARRRARELNPELDLDTKP